jgi:quercetin dioxygenase-like cupin family protein
MPAPLHLVVHGKEMRAGVPGVFEGHAQGLSRTTLLDREAGSVHVGYSIPELAPGGTVDRAIHAFEKTIYVLSGELQLERDGTLIRLAKDDYALVPTGTPHALRNAAKQAVQWVEVSTPQPKPAGGWRDTFFVETLDWGRLFEAPPPGDPRRKLAGHHDGTMPPGAHMHGDLRGFSIRYFVDRDFAKGGICNHHDHPFEEAYLVLDGDVDIVFDGRAYTLQRGDFAWTGVGSRHAFFPVEGRPVRWLEIQAPQPPAQGGMRWHSRWEELARLIDGGAG